jgi:hypothetical protein
MHTYREQHELTIMYATLFIVVHYIRDLLHNAAKIKMKPMLEQLCYEFER